MAYTPLGYSLPDLSITGYAAPTASWGGSVDVSVTVRNTGASTLPEPFAQAPGDVSSADAPATTVAVYASPRANSSRGQVLVGTFDIPMTRQNTFQQVSSTISLPTQPRGFAGDGGAIFLRFQVNPDLAFTEVNYKNNTTAASTRVRIEAPLPQLQAVSLDVPPVMQPGDTIDPTIQVANVGTTATSIQGPVTVALVASVDRKFGPGSSIVGLYQVANIPAISTAPSKSDSLDNSQNINQPNNIVTISGSPVTLPTRPGKYYLGVVIDPNNQIKQLGRIGRVRSSIGAFSLIHQVGPVDSGLPPAGVATTSPTNLPFPYPATTTTVGYSNNTTTD
ncbi:hypothetical protein [Singulisphaera sp. PoT]|uniref:hypothetical protein n=1 Tax=Singulisphaera sp. PoT TaxID=3411797 RepID=UPI003BF46794